MRNLLATAFACKPTNLDGTGYVNTVEYQPAKPPLGTCLLDHIGKCQHWLRKWTYPIKLQSLC